jgi:hypothetical protein
VSFAPFPFPRFLIAHLSFAFSRFPIPFLAPAFPGFALTVPGFTPALAIQTLAIHAFAVLACMLLVFALHAIVLQAFVLTALALLAFALQAIVVLASTFFLLALLGLLMLVTLVVERCPRRQRGSESEQDGSGCDQSSHDVLLGCVLYGRART